MTTKVRNLCQECSDWYEYEIGAESSEHCPKCLFAEAEGTAEEIKDLWERVDSAETDWKETETDNNKLIKERDELNSQIEALDCSIYDLRAEIKEARSMIQEPVLIAVKLSTSITEVLQLDDPEMLDVFGIECEPVGKGLKQISVRGTSEALGKLLCACLSRARGKQGGWDQPARYTRSASAAAERLEAVL